MRCVLCWIIRMLVVIRATHSYVRRTGTRWHVHLSDSLPKATRALYCDAVDCPHLSCHTICSNCIINPPRWSSSTFDPTRRLGGRSYLGLASCNPNEGGLQCANDPLCIRPPASLLCMRTEEQCVALFNLLCEYRLIDGIYGEPHATHVMNRLVFVSVLCLCLASHGSLTADDLDLFIQAGDKGTRIQWNLQSSLGWYSDLYRAMYRGVNLDIPFRLVTGDM